MKLFINFFKVIFFLIFIFPYVLVAQPSSILKIKDIKGKNISGVKVSRVEVDTVTNNSTFPGLVVLNNGKTNIPFPVDGENKALFVKIEAPEYQPQIVEIKKGELLPEIRISLVKDYKYPEDFFPNATPPNGYKYGQYHFENDYWSLIYPNFTIKSLSKNGIRIDSPLNFIAQARKNKFTGNYLSAINQLNYLENYILDIDPNTANPHEEFSRLKKYLIEKSRDGFLDDNAQQIIQSNQLRFENTATLSSLSERHLIVNARKEENTYFKRFNHRFLNYLSNPTFLHDKTSNHKTPEMFFSGYHYKYLILPVMQSHLLTTVGRFEKANYKLFGVYYKRMFREKLKAEKEQQFTAVYKKELPDEKKRSAEESIDMFNMISQNLYGEEHLHDIEKEFLKIQIAKNYLEWGDYLYKTQINNQAIDNKDDIISKYAQILRIFYNYWENTILNRNEDLIKYYNPVVLELVYQADMQLNKLNAGLNYLGYSEDYVPLWNYTFLRNISKEFIENARRLEERAFTSFDRAESETKKLLNLRQGVEIAQESVRLDKSKLEFANQSLKIALENKILAEERIKHKRGQIEGFINLHPAASVNHGDDLALSGAIYYLGGPYIAIGYLAGTYIEGPVGDAVGFVGDIASQVGSWFSSESPILGWPNRVKEEKEQLNQLFRELAELKNVLIIAIKEVEKQSISKDIANQGLNISELQKSHQIELLNFNLSKNLNKEFWYQFSNDLKSLSNRYIEYGIELAWLTERAYEIEEERNVNIIRSDYIPLINTNRNWLASERLLIDLNEIEFQRVTNKRNKEVHVSHVISLRNKDLLGLMEMKENGEIQFNITPQELDLAFPGTYRRLIDDIEITVVALSNYSRIHGRLTKAGISWQRTLLPQANTTYWNDWLENDSYNIIGVQSIPETMMFPKSQNIRSNTIDSGLLKIFEGHGVSGMYELELPKYSNRFDYKTIIDVFITVHFSAYYNDNLKNIIENKICELIRTDELVYGEKIGFSFQNNFPDEFYYFQNPITPIDSLRNLSFQFTESDLPPNQENQELSSIWLSFVGENGFIPVDDVNLISPSGNIITDLEYITETNPVTNDVTIHAMRLRRDINGSIPLLGNWQIQVNSSNFDYSTIKDVFIQFGYDYQPSINCN